MECIKKIQIDNTIYEANVDFRIAIQCNEIAQEKEIGDFERTLAVIYLVFGEKGLDNIEHYNLLIDWIKKWLSLGKEIENSNEEPDMDFIEDYDLIVASFQSDYGIDIDNTEMDWKRFINLMNGLSNSELGNCCVLNRIRNIRTYDTREIKDEKIRRKYEKIKKQVALKKNKKEINLTEKQIKSIEELNSIIGLKKEGG